MKVSKIWQIVTLLLIGFVIGVFAAITTVQKNLPPSQSIEISGIKIKAKKDAQVDVNIDTQQDDQSDNSKKKRLFGRKK